EQEQRRQVFDRDRHPDLESLDREEIRGVDHRQPGHTEEGKRRQLAAVDAQKVAPRDREQRQQDQPGAGRPELGETGSADPIVEEVPRQIRVERPEAGADRRKQVSAGGATGNGARAAHLTSRSNSSRPLRARYSAKRASEVSPRGST